MRRVYCSHVCATRAYWSRHHDQVNAKRRKLAPPVSSAPQVVESTLPLWAQDELSLSERIALIRQHREELRANTREITAAAQSALLRSRTNLRAS
jgi:hypothetical protein